MEFKITTDKLGDTILQEPALTAKAKSICQPVNLFVQNEKLRPLFGNHAWINPAADCSDDAIELSAQSAFDFAVSNRLPFAAGYFPQVGLIPNRTDRLYFKCYCLPDLTCRTGVVIAPFSYSDNGNILPPAGFWQELIARLDRQVISLGAAADPEIVGTVNLRGLDWLSVCRELRQSQVFVSVETGLLHLATACCRRTVFLSSATPETLCKPSCAITEVVRAALPRCFSVADTLAAIERALK